MKPLSRTSDIDIVVSLIRFSGCGKQKGNTQIYRGVEYTVHLIPKVKIEIVVMDKYVEEIIQIITKEARTGEIGDGKIFVSAVENAITTRTGATGEQAV